MQLEKIGRGQNKKGGAEMSKKEATREQILEVMDQTKRWQLGWASYQGFIDEGSGIGFQYLVKKIIDEARQSFRDCKNFEEQVITDVAIAGITRDPEDIKKIYTYPPAGVKPSVEAAYLFHRWNDVEMVRESIKSKWLEGYYLAKAYVVLYKATEADMKYINLALKEALEVDDLYLRAKVLLEVRNYLEGNKLESGCIDSELSRIRESSQRFDKYQAARIATLSILENKAEPDWAREKIRELVRKLGNNMHRAVLFTSIAAATRDLNDLEIAYEAAREGPEGEIWRAMTRALAGID